MTNQAKEIKDNILKTSKREIQPLLQSSFNLADTNMFYRNGESFKIGGNLKNSKIGTTEYDLYFLKWITGHSILGMSVPVRYVFVVLSMKDQELKKRILIELNKLEHHKPADAELVSEYLTSLSPISQGSDELLDSIGRRLNMHYSHSSKRGRRYSFQRLGPVVITRNYDFAVPYVDLTSVETLAKQTELDMHSAAIKASQPPAAHDHIH